MLATIQSRKFFFRLLSNKVKIRMYKTIILAMAFKGCETWYLILREQQILRVFEKRALRRILGPNRNGVTGS
jgi:hypothetical protein